MLERPDGARAGPARRAGAARRPQRAHTPEASSGMRLWAKEAAHPDREHVGRDADVGLEQWRKKRAREADTLGPLPHALVRRHLDRQQAEEVPPEAQPGLVDGRGRDARRHRRQLELCRRRVDARRAAPAGAARDSALAVARACGHARIGHGRVGQPIAVDGDLVMLTRGLVLEPPACATADSSPLHTPGDAVMTSPWQPQAQLGRR